MISSVLLLTGCGVNGPFTDTNLKVPTLTITSSSIVKGKLLTVTAADKKPNAPLGENQSPALSWESVEGANYYAVIMFDETANWLHFLVTDITDTQIEQGKYSGAKVYIGPYPPKSTGVHTYRVEVFAIKEKPNNAIGEVDSKGSYSGIVNNLNQVGGHSDNILARGYITGTYQNGANIVDDTK